MGISGVRVATFTFVTHVEESPDRGLNAALSRVLRGEVRAAGFSYDSLAEATGLSKSTVNRLLKENPTRHLDVTVVYAICRTIGVDPTEVWERAVLRANQGGQTPQEQATEIVRDARARARGKADAEDEPGSGKVRASRRKSGSA